MGATADDVGCSVAGGTAPCWRDRPVRPAAADGDRLQETESRLTDWAFESGGLLAAVAVQRVLRCPWTLLVASRASNLPLSVPTPGGTQVDQSLGWSPCAGWCLAWRGSGHLSRSRAAARTLMDRTFKRRAKPRALRPLRFAEPDVAAVSVLVVVLRRTSLRIRGRCWLGVSVRWWGSVGWRVVGGDRRSRSPTR
jgi:hypothetical protein